MSFTFGKFKILTFLMSTAVSVQSYAAPGKTTINQALALTYQNNSSLRAAVLNQFAADEAVPQAISAFRPSVQAKGEQKSIRNEQQHVDSNRMNAKERRRYGFDSTAANVQVSQNIFAGGRDSAGIRAAEMSVLAGRADFVNTQQQIFINAVQTYMDVLLYREVVDYHISNIKFLKDQLEAVITSVDLGEKTPTDVAQAEAALADGEASLTNAKANLQTAEAQYVSIIGEKPGQLESPEIIKDLPETRESLMNAAKESAPEVVKAQYAFQASKSQIDQQAAGLLPSIDIGGSMERNLGVGDRKNRTNSISAQATLTIPLFTQGAVSSKIRQATSSSGKARLELDQARKNAEAVATKAWESWIAAKQQISQHQSQVKFATLARDGKVYGSQVGENDYFEVINTQSTLLQAQIKLAQAKHDEVVARYSILQALGELTAGRLQLPVEQYDLEAHYQQVRSKWFGGEEIPQNLKPQDGIKED